MRGRPVGVFLPQLLQPPARARQPLAALRLALRILPGRQQRGVVGLGGGGQPLQLGRAAVRLCPGAGPVVGRVPRGVRLPERAGEGRKVGSRPASSPRPLGQGLRPRFSRRRRASTPLLRPHPATRTSRDARPTG
jgi:hypothetical protein